MIKNIIANYVGRIWSLISVFIFVPFYIKLLGIESYAVINFYTVILTLMYFADAGLSATLNREIARTTDKEYLGNLLYTIERVYLVICLIIAISVSLFSAYIANNWLRSSSISQTDLSNYIRLIGFSVAFQLFTTLQNSGLMGLEKQVLSNTIQVSGNVVRSAIVLIPLYFFRNLYIYLGWQLLVNAIVFFITRDQLWKSIKTTIQCRFNRVILNTIGKFAGGMMMMSIISSLNTQIDKLLISKLLSLKEFGYYSLAGIISQSPEIIITPIALAILPKMTKFSQQEDKVKLTKLFHQYSVIMAMVACSVTLVLFLYTEDFIFIWTHNKEIVSAIDKVTRVLLVGSVFLAFQYMPYYLAISQGHTTSNIKIGLICIIVIVPSLFFFIKRFGLIGAPWTWLALNLFAYLYLGYFLIKKFLKGEFQRWLLSDTLTPAIISLAIGLIIHYTTSYLPKGYYILIYSAVIGATCLYINYWVYNKINPKYKLILNEIIRNRIN